MSERFPLWLSAVGSGGFGAEADGRWWLRGLTLTRFDGHLPGGPAAQSTSRTAPVVSRSAPLKTPTWSHATGELVVPSLWRATL